MSKLIWQLYNDNIISMETATMQNKTTEEFINNKFFYETLDIPEDYDNRVLE